MPLGYYARLEPRTRGDDLTPGLAARVYDAAWLLARQWQFGELGGDDAGTPISVRHTGATTWCTTYTDAAGTRPLTPGDGPLEEWIQAAPRTITVRQQVDLGRALLRTLREAGLDDRIPAILDAFPLNPATDPADPAADLLAVTATRIPDGGTALNTLGPTLRADAPTLPALPNLIIDDAVISAALGWLAFCDAVIGPPASAAWDASRLEYTCTVTAPSPAGGLDLTAQEYGGGTLDWWALDATPLNSDPDARTDPHDATTIPTRVSMRGMPVPRWWQQEDAAIDLGGVEANAADLGDR